MIEAQHRAWAHLIFKPYIRHLTAKHFSALHRVGDWPEINNNDQLILLPNHSTWWDGFFVYLLNESLWKRRLYLMMLQEQLQRFRFFSKVGAFGIDRESTAEVKKALRYSLDRVADSGNMLCLFPQGELQPYGVRPIEYGRGVEFMLKQLPQARVLLLGIRAEFVQEQRAAVYMTAEEASGADIKELSCRHARLLGKLDQSIVSGAAVDTFFKGKQSLSA